MGTLTVSKLQIGEKYVILRWDSVADAFDEAKSKVVQRFTAKKETEVYKDSKSFSSDGATYYRCQEDAEQLVVWLLVRDEKYRKMIHEDPWMPNATVLDLEIGIVNLFLGRRFPCAACRLCIFRKLPGQAQVQVPKPSSKPSLQKGGQVMANLSFWLSNLLIKLVSILRWARIPDDLVPC